MVSACGQRLLFIELRELSERALSGKTNGDVCGLHYAGFRKQASISNPEMRYYPEHCSTTRMSEPFQNGLTVNHADKKPQVSRYPRGIRYLLGIGYLRSIGYHISIRYLLDIGPYGGHD
jgi:hypothetical protein